MPLNLVSAFSPLYCASSLDGYEVMKKYDKIDTPEIVDSLFNVHSGSITACPEHAEDIEFRTSDQIRLVCRFFQAGKDAPTLLHFHDSMRSTKIYDIIANDYTRNNINFLLASYRGTGRNSGNPSISSMMVDADFILQETILLRQKKDLKGPLFLMGNSLGCACVIDIAYNHADSIKGIIIESGFCDTVPFLTGLGHDINQSGITEDDGFNNKEKIEKVKLPTLILHGARDSLVPPAQAEVLQASSGARNKQFHIIPGADRQTMIETGGDLYFQTIKNFVDMVSGINTWRQRRKNNKHRK